MERPQADPARSLRQLPRPVAQVLAAVVALTVLLALPRPQPPALPVAQPSVDTWQQRAAAAETAAAGGPGAVSFVVLDGDGREVASLNPENRVPAASTIKALILAAYLRQPQVADRDLRPAEAAAMGRMITASSNTDATELLRKVGWDGIRQLALDAGITQGFTPDTQSWGLSQVTARSLATFFHELPALVPQRHRTFATGLFGKIIPSQQWGMPAATPQDWSWYVKAGWINSVVNQVGAFVRGSEEFTVAITIEGDPGLGSSLDVQPDTSPAAGTLAAVTGALFGSGDLPGAGVTVCEVAQPAARPVSTPGWAGQPPCGPPLRAM